MGKFLRKQILSDAGDVLCNDSMILSIITLSAKEISGIASMDNSFASKLKGKTNKNYFEGASFKYINKDYNEIIVDVYVNVFANYNVSEIAYKVQQNIMTAVQNMAGIKVKKVNVHVVGVEFYAEEN